MQTLTYGDTFTLPSAPGVTWKIEDVRSLDDLGNPHAIRAHAYPVGARGPVKIGRAERNGVYIAISKDRAYARAGTWDQALTDAQDRAIEADLAALTFDVPPLTPSEIVARMTDTLTRDIPSAARKLWDSIPDRYNAAHDGSAAKMTGDAFRATPGAFDALMDALTAEFRTEATKTLAHYLDTPRAKKGN